MQSHRYRECGSEPAFRVPRCMIPLESRMREIRTSRFGGQGVETGLWEPD